MYMEFPCKQDKERKFKRAWVAALSTRSFHINEARDAPGSLGSSAFYMEIPCKRGRTPHGPLGCGAVYMVYM